VEYRMCLEYRKTSNVATKTGPELGEIREGVILNGFYNLRLKVEPNHSLGL
jgi:hypothetical protein